MELRIIANVKNDRMAMSKIKMFRISDELSSHIHVSCPEISRSVLCRADIVSLK